MIQNHLPVFQKQNLKSYFKDEIHIQVRQWNISSFHLHSFSLVTGSYWFLCNLPSPSTALFLSTSQSFDFHAQPGGAFWAEGPGTSSPFYLKRTSQWRIYQAGEIRQKEGSYRISPVIFSSWFEVATGKTSDLILKDIYQIFFMPFIRIVEQTERKAKLNFSIILGAM